MEVEYWMNEIQKQEKAENEKLLIIIFDIFIVIYLVFWYIHWLIICINIAALIGCYDI